MRTNVDCVKCGGFLELNRMFKYAYCKACHNEYTRVNTRKVPYKYLDLEEKIKQRARSRLHMAVSDGRVKRESCVICGKQAEAHHPDYSKPLEVVWLCREHHIEAHRITK